jgi:hypothetical protein
MLKTKFFDFGSVCGIALKYIFQQFFPCLKSRGGSGQDCGLSCIRECHGRGIPGLLGPGFKRTGRTFPLEPGSTSKETQAILLRRNPGNEYPSRVLQT